MNARDVIAIALFNADDTGRPCQVEWERQFRHVRTRYQDKADAALSSLRASGYRILAPGQLDDETLEAAAKVADADVPDGFSWGPGNGIATAIRNMKEKPDAR